MYGDMTQEEAIKEFARLLIPIIRLKDDNSNSSLKGEKGTNNKVIMFCIYSLPS